MNSQDHHMMGSVDAWFYEALGGINVDPDHPGYRHIRIRAADGARSYFGERHGGHGARQRDILLDPRPGSRHSQVDVPVNSTATVSIPKEEQMTRDYRARGRPNRLGERTICGRYTGCHGREV